MASDTVSKLCLAWKCKTCEAECIPIGPSSNCMCNHRLRDHGKRGRGETARDFGCSSSRCDCKQFRYLVSSGAWKTVCSCKHKHTDHTNRPPYKCTKPRCSCVKFFSPFVCNCDHPWSHHVTAYIRKDFQSIASRFADGLADPTLVVRDPDMAPLRADRQAAASSSDPPPSSSCPPPSSDYPS
ncbi:uncharacterized protein AMSG_02998 [Thecamonas trahens ATCC 50062]|uniref:Protein FAM221A n=1 Tax=Thecamonas trahens ATCC 50062 TaxID=461836 RepID=A0A0L0D2N7_THETB|nr:hypothetical protein AMSG_02998 [Thecamonas trahens ATCC 50062]KNC46562.1 hypothetical protein AMSG_02998 [Thecamonas trahens ATCC 50062]|eukprot:XP_013760341.1 hypothetical protein AMSG_02998 [Thecamonas trahens ATCC 50062]